MARRTTDSPDPALRADGLPRRRLRGPQRRERILDSALEVFASRGFEAASMEELAANAGVSRPVLYDHFGSKRDLFIAVLERERGSIMAAVVDSSSPGDSAEARIRALIDAFFRHVETHPTTWRTLFQDVVGDAEALSAQRHVQAEANMLVAGRLAHERGALSGLETSGPQLQILAEVWGWALKGLARWWYEHPEIGRDELVDTVMLAFWRGLRELLSGGKISAPATTAPRPKEPDATRRSSTARKRAK